MALRWHWGKLPKEAGNACGEPPRCGAARSASGFPRCHCSVTRADQVWLGPGLVCWLGSGSSVVSVQLRCRCRSGQANSSPGQVKRGGVPLRAGARCSLCPTLDAVSLPDTAAWKFKNSEFQNHGRGHYQQRCPNARLSGAVAQFFSNLIVLHPDWSGNFVAHARQATPADAWYQSDTILRIGMRPERDCESALAQTRM